MRAAVVVVALATVVALAAAACRGSSSSGDPPDPSASPQAKAEPAPIASSPPTPGAATPAGSASAAPPQPLRADEAVPLEPPPKEPAAAAPPSARDPSVPSKDPAKEAPVVYALALAIRPSDVASPPKGVELSGPGLDAARRKSEPSLAVDLTPGHARAVLHEGFVLPEGTDIRVRADRLGYVVVAPDGESYRVGAMGSLRAILEEGLFDVAPTSPAEVTPRGDGAKRLGRPTRRVEVMTRAARAAFELAHVPDAGDGGALVCRMLLDLMSARAGTQVCGDGDVPLHVELRWSAQPSPPPGARPRSSGVATFEAVSFARRTDLAFPAFVAAFASPPPAARFTPTGEAIRGSHLFLSRADLAAMHVGAPESAHPGDPSAILSLHNSSDELRFVWLDGVPLAWLAPGGRLDVSGVAHARATLQWRTFLGDAIDAADTVTLPATVDAVPQPGAPAANASDSPPP